MWLWTLFFFFQGISSFTILFQLSRNSEISTQFWCQYYEFMVQYLHITYTFWEVYLNLFHSKVSSSRINYPGLRPYSNFVPKGSNIHQDSYRIEKLARAQHLVKEFNTTWFFKNVFETSVSQLFVPDIYYRRKRH